MAGVSEIDRKTELQVQVQAPQSSIIFRQLESTEHAVKVEEEGESDGGRAQGRRQAGGVRWIKTKCGFDSCASCEREFTS